VTPVLFDSRFLVNTDIAFYVFFHKAFLTMSHTFASLCVSLRLFFICFYFRLGSNGPHSTSHVIYIFFFVRFCDVWSMTQRRVMNKYLQIMILYVK
jgi:hypothetical protein